MRGIAGWATTLPRTAPDDAVLLAMADSIAHRNSSCEDLKAVLDRNPRRQVVLAASLADEQSRISLVLDGSILNHQELRSILEKKGFVFKGKSDEELLLRAYQQWDKDVVKQLRGAFALAIWDARKERLLLARDRFGEKPLYLHERPSRLFFASEAKALLKVPGIDARVDMRAFWDCLASHYVPGPRTLFEGIRKLPPGSYATWQLGRLQEVRYWTPPDRQRFSAEEPSEVVEGFIETFQESVRLRAGSGVLLSGGLDSAAIVAVLAKDGKSVRTFTLGFDGDPKTELPAAAEIAKQFGTEHHEIVVAPKDLVSGLAKLVQSRDAPATRPSELAVHHLAGVAGRSAPALLSGDGCDEVIGGYRRLIVPAYARWDMGREFDAREKIFTGNLKQDSEKTKPPFDVDPESSPLRKALYAGQTTWLPDELLERSDRAAALAGAEARLPYLDHRLAEYVSSLPDDRRVRGLATKWILREAGKRLIPSGLARRKKGGFRMPIRDWLRNELRDTLLEHLQGGGSRTRKYYDAARLDRVLDEHLQGKNNHARLLWTLLNLEIWHRSYRPA